jgi:molybdopterin converting factor small subunit
VGSFAVRVKVRYFGYLADYVGFRDVEVEVPDGSRIAEVVKLPPDVSLGEVVLLRNGLPAKPHERLSDGDVVSVLPRISGGLVSLK